jgi:ADP-ribose pyrophosphatase YjhB (NUDIX family)
LSRISDLVPEGEGRWTLPGGGMDWGETAEETLRREMWEETGLLPEIGPLMYVHSFGFERPGVHYHSMRAVYRVDVRGEPAVTEIGGSVDLAAWHELDRLHEIPLVRLVIEALDRL